jgi:hypothetical protein
MFQMRIETINTQAEKVGNPKKKNENCKRAEKTNTKQCHEIDQVPLRSEHSLLTDHNRRAPLVEMRYTGLPVVKASMEMAV